MIELARLALLIAASLLALFGIGSAVRVGMEASENEGNTLTRRCAAAAAIGFMVTALSLAYGAGSL